MTDKTFTYTFHGDPSPVDPQDLATQMFGTPSPQEARQEADQLLAMFLQAGLTPDQIVEYLQNAPWRQRATAPQVTDS